MKEYKEVPYIIGTKDLDYLSDMFNWHYGAYKNTLDVINNLTDKSLKKAVEKVNNTFYELMEELLNIMKEKINED